MAATNTTTNYGFPLYTDADSTSWADFNKLSTDVDAQIKAVADSGSTTNGQVEELTTKVDTLTQTVNAQDAIITQQGTEITKLTNDAATTDEAIDGLQQKATANETNISNLSTQVTGTILPEVEKNTTDITSVETSLTTLSTTVSQQGTRITTLEGKVPNDLQSQLTTLNSSIDVVEGEIASGFPIKTEPALSLKMAYEPSSTGGYVTISCDGTPPDGLYLATINVSGVRTSTPTYRGIGYMWAEDADSLSGRSKVISSCTIFNAVNSPSISLRLSFLVQLISATPDMDVGYVKVMGDLNSSTQGLDNLLFNTGNFESNKIIALN